MKLSELASHYVAYKQAMGMRFDTEARTLRPFCRTMGDIAVADIAADRATRETLPVLLRSRAVLPCHAIRKHLGAVGE